MTHNKDVDLSVIECFSLKRGRSKEVNIVVNPKYETQITSMHLQKLYSLTTLQKFERNGF